MRGTLFQLVTVDGSRLTAFRSENPVRAARRAARDARLAEDFGAEQLAVDDQLLIAELPVLARQLHLRAVPLGQHVRAVVQLLGLGLVAHLAQQLRQTPHARVELQAFELRPQAPDGLARAPAEDRVESALAPHLADLP